MFDIIGFIVWGLIIGAVARLIKPGKQNLSILATMGLGMVGSVIGGLIAASSAPAASSSWTSWASCSP